MSSSRVTPVFVQPSIGKEDGFTNATNIDEIVKFCCPRFFAPGMKILLKEVYSTEVRRLNVAASVEMLSNHLTAGTYPPKFKGPSNPQRFNSP
ncbi:BgTH12-04196 [Blumeria graminis f. sp. triticale]|uniref:BgtAc-31491 n=3 Tax=Blumeria graminis TaxID=34373 RepID=A0A9X9L9M4_BLUGR|nr:hypothetical protein BGT96224_Ac31491 [Blumeria graminis f. sp. tritici 96224]CAD6500093.1 BgTH12-04196 [Blumeria graminis f. sp. triticale]VCU40307.1 BgtAc-31491 [Blumeria graminis f. sp. tritici]